MDLSGTWRATAVHEELRRTFHEPQLDDRTWCEVEVPGHWSQAPALAEEHAVLHRFGFEATGPDDDHRAWLHLEGICQQGDVWLDGAYVGDTEGYFVPHAFEITDLLRARSQHLLAVDVSCPTYGDPNSRTDLLGAFLDPELSGSAGLNPGGIWRPVTIRQTGCTSILHFRAVCTDANPTRARVTMRCVFDTPASGQVVLRTRVAGRDHEFRHPAAAGENRVEWTFDVTEPELWWPHTLGDQPLHDLKCEVVVGGEVHDTRQCRIGFRSIRLDDWKLSVNRTRIFVKGAAVLPTTARPGDADERMVAGDLEAAREAGLDLVRCQTHIATPEFYQRADELGLLIWQDMPLRGLMARGVRKQAVRQTREAVDLLAHHPSVAIWCGHDEPHRQPEQPLTTPPVISQQMPSWNRMVLDSSIKRVLERTDGSRPIVAHTGVPPHLPQLDGSTSSLWFGWSGGRAADLTAWIARFPRMGRFISGFGAATVSARSHPTGIDDWPDPDWQRIGRSVGADPSSLQHLVPPRHIHSRHDWARLTEAAQANVVRTTIEQLRKLKYRPVGGFIQHYLIDPSPSGGFGVIDRSRAPKAAAEALTEACRPVIVVADPLPLMTHRGDPIKVDVHVVSDLQTDLPDAVVTATIQVGSEVLHIQGWTGPVQADECTFIGTVSFTIPDSVTSETDTIELLLHLESDSVEVGNHYLSQLI